MVDLVYKTKLTDEEKQENIYWIRYIQENFPDLGLSFESVGYEEVPDLSYLVEQFPLLGKFLFNLRYKLLQGYFIKKTTDLEWEWIQSLLENHNVKLRLWFDKHSILRKSHISGMNGKVYYLKQRKNELLSINSNCNNTEFIEEIKVRLSEISRNDISNVNKISITLRIALVKELLQKSYELLCDLYQIQQKYLNK